jgi:cytochrome c-type biogenesis protein CcmH/NrfG
MTSTLILSVLLVGAQASAMAMPPANDIEQREVAYEELTSGRLAQAVAALEVRASEMPDDPATLINLGSAYAMSGDKARAAKAFRAAMTSDTRYRLELADGHGVDSRVAAREALARVERAPSLAALND